MMRTISLIIVIGAITSVFGLPAFADTIVFDDDFSAWTYTTFGAGSLVMGNDNSDSLKWDLTATGVSGSYLFGDGSIYLCKNDDASPDNHAIRLYHDDGITFNVTNGGTISNGGFSVDNNGSIDTSGDL